jgi:hypothetical protein
MLKNESIRHAQQLIHALISDFGLIQQQANIVTFSNTGDVFGHGVSVVH